jgi:hypothetical protein
LYRGPVISPAAKERIIGLVSSAEPEGRRILLDGRNIRTEAYPDGNLIGPTVIEASTTMKWYNEEIFGPILTILHAKTLDEALKIVDKKTSFSFFVCTYTLLVCSSFTVIVLGFLRLGELVTGPSNSKSISTTKRRLPSRLSIRKKHGTEVREPDAEKHRM